MRWSARTIAITLAGVVASALLTGVTDARGAPLRAAARVSCFGAAAFAAPAGVCPPTTRAPVTPAPDQAAHDRSDAWRVVNGRDCFSHSPTFPVVTCLRGASAATAVGHVAVVGNSHAGQWLSAIEQLAASKHWQITTYLASGCAWSDIAQHWPTVAASRACTAWAEATARRVTRGYGLIIITNKVSHTAEGYDLAHSWAVYQAGYQKLLRVLLQTRRRVVGIRDTPSPVILIPACLAAHPSNYAPCTVSRATALPPEPLTAAIAAMRSPQMIMADMTRYFCTTTSCPGAIGSVPVYFDGSHLAATYARTVTPYLTPAIMRAF